MNTYDNSVLRDAASQLEGAARRLRKALKLKDDEEHPLDQVQRAGLIGEARALLYAAEARVK